MLALYRAAAAAEAAPGVKWQSFDEPSRHLQAPRRRPVVAATYDFPYLAHAPMEPMNCVAEIGGGKLKLTVGSQIPTIDQLNTALIVGALPAQVEIESCSPAARSAGAPTSSRTTSPSACTSPSTWAAVGR